MVKASENPRKIVAAATKQNSAMPATSAVVVLFLLLLLIRASISAIDDLLVALWNGTLGTVFVYPFQSQIVSE